jgi:hypothetical protein
MAPIWLVCGIAGGLLALPGIQWVRAEARMPPHVISPGTVELTHGKRYLALAIAMCVVAPTVVLIPAFIVGFPRPRDFLIFAAILALFVLGATYMLVTALRTRVLVSPEGVTTTRFVFGTTLFKPWDDINRVSFSLFTDCFVLTGGTSRPIKVSVSLRGIGALVGELRARVPESGFSQACRVVLRSWGAA